MKDEYDFSKGERGKYAKQYTAGTNVILLDPDVAKEFPSSESVNKALRSLIQQRAVLVPGRTKVTQSN